MDYLIAHTIAIVLMGVLLIPISAIVLGILSSIIKSILQSQERRLQMKIAAQNTVVGLSDNSVQDLRAEIARLRDTTTEHAMSMQHAMERLEQRVAFLECKTLDASGTPASSYPPPSQHTVGYR